MIIAEAASTMHANFKAKCLTTVGPFYGHHCTCCEVSVTFNVCEKWIGGLSEDTAIAGVCSLSCHLSCVEDVLNAPQRLWEGESVLSSQQPYLNSWLDLQILVNRPNYKTCSVEHNVSLLYILKLNCKIVKDLFPIADVLETFVDHYVG